MEEPPEGRDLVGAATPQSAQVQLCTELSALEPPQDALSSCSPKALAGRGWKGPSRCPGLQKGFRIFWAARKVMNQREIKAPIPNKAPGEVWIMMGRM